MHPCSGSPQDADVAQLLNVKKFCSRRPPPKVASGEWNRFRSSRNGPRRRRKRSRRPDNQRMNAESTHDVKDIPWSPASVAEPRLLADIGATYARFCVED